MGKGALSVVSGGHDNAALGLQALYFDTFGAENAAVGVSALNSNTSGLGNSALGYSALNSNSTGQYNAAAGFEALYSDTASYNSAFGTYALDSITSGGFDAALGFQAGHYVSGGSVANSTSGSSVYLGAETYPLANGDTNEIVIGANAVGLGSNTAVLGSSTISTTALFGNVGIGTTAPATTLNVTGGTNPTVLIGGGTIPGCLELSNSNGTSGINYITALNGTLTATTTKPSSCQ